MVVGTGCFGAGNSYQNLASRAEEKKRAKQVVQTTPKAKQTRTSSDGSVVQTSRRWRLRQAGAVHGLRESVHPVLRDFRMPRHPDVTTDITVRGITTERRR